MNKINEFYNQYTENKRLETKRSRQLEFITTMEYVKKYANQSSIVADIGAGTGIYSFELASICKGIVAVDIVEKHVNEISSKIERLGIKNIAAKYGSAVDLRSLESNHFDIVLCLGPYYHLQKKEDRIKCITECTRILKNNGLLFIGYINRQNAMLYYVKNRKYLDSSLYEKLECDNYTETSGFDPFLDISFFSDPDLVKKEAESSGLEIVKDIGVDGIFYFLEDELTEMNEQQWNDLLKFHLKHCEDKSSFGMSMHGLAICKKYEKPDCA